MAMFQREGGSSNGDKTTVIGATVKVDGNFVGSGDVIVEGHVSGTLKTSKNLVIGPQATIKADVEAANIEIAGEIRGQVKCSGKLAVAASGKIFGNVDTKTIAVEHGATIHGKVTMTGESQPATKKGSTEE